VLEVRDLTVKYGHVQAVNGVSLHVGRGEIVSLLGANGAGKSSFFRALSGLVPISGGAVRLRGADLPLRQAHKITRRGLVHVPEGRRVIASLDVVENLRVAADGSGRRRGREVTEAMEEVFGLFPKLKDRRHQASGLMSGGEQQMLAIARGLMARPEVLLLDEPSMGLAPIIVREIFETLRHRAGTIADVAILLSEQSSGLALGVSDHAYVLSRGNLVFDGSAADVTADVTISAYLGAQAGSESAPDASHDRAPGALPPQ
jgi:branched-chain amino acid transport system ATP-binding protein